MQIRNVNQKDFNELFELVMENMVYHMKLTKLNWEPISKIRKAEFSELKKDLKNPKTKIFVYEIQGKIVGYVNCSLQGKNPYTKTKKKGEINDLFVLEKYRKQGIGKALIKKAISFFKSKNVKNISISVNSNNIPTLRVYEKLGFKESVKKMFLTLK